MRRRPSVNCNRLITTTALLFSAVGRTHAASQLTIFFAQVKTAERDPQHPSKLINAVNLDFTSMNLSDEIPAIQEALQSGDPVVMKKAVQACSELLRSLSVKDAVNGQNDYDETEWMLSVIDLVAISGSAPSTEMVDWIEQAVTTSSQRTSKAVAQISESYTAAGTPLAPAERDSFVRGAGEENQNLFRHLAPVLAKVRPLGPDELRTLVALLHQPDTTTKILVIGEISSNHIHDPAVIRELIAAALNDPDIPVWVRHGMLPFPVRVAVIKALGALNATAALPDLRRTAASTDDDRHWAALSALQTIEGVKAAK